MLFPHTETHSFTLFIYLLLSFSLLSSPYLTLSPFQSWPAFAVIRKKAKKSHQANYANYSLNQLRALGHTDIPPSLSIQSPNQLMVQQRSVAYPSEQINKKRRLDGCTWQKMKQSNGRNVINTIHKCAHTQAHTYAAQWCVKGGRRGCGGKRDSCDRNEANDDESLWSRSYFYA